MVTIKRLAQTALSDSATAVYTAPASTTTQVTEIYLANTGADERTVTLYQGGTADANMIMNGIVIPANGAVLIQDTKIIIEATQTLAAKQDTGTDIILTMYGVEETV